MRRLSKPRRYVLASAGVACVGLGSVGAVVPGLPTTPFLLLAAWCFARSNPELGRRLLSHRLFRPYRPYLDGTQPIPARVRWITVGLVWAVVGASALALSSGWLTVLLVAAALTGSVVILRWRR
jgi:uncharacterized membrane protein YbaN (DUF454 family)